MMDDVAVGGQSRLEAVRKAQPLAGRKILIIVENLPLPFDRRVWHECRTLTAAGAQVAVICPTGKGYEDSYELIDGVHIYRHPLPVDAKNASGYLVEYGAALWHEMRLAIRIFRRHGFDTVQACNPPDLMFSDCAAFQMDGSEASSLTITILTPSFMKPNLAGAGSFGS